MTGADLGATGVSAYKGVAGLVGDIGDGNVLAAGKDLWDLGKLGGDVMKFASGAQGNLLGDPLEALIEAGLDFLIDLVAPLKDALNLVTGDAEGLSGKAKEWAAVAQELRTLGPAAALNAQQTTASWTGVAGDAFRAKMTRFDRGVRSVAGQADHVADVLRISSTLMDAAQSIIKGIIASWVEYAILTEAAAAASAVFTFGASEAAGQAAVAGEAAVACGRGADTVGQASGIMQRLASAVRQLEGTFSRLGTALDEEAQVMRQVEGGLRTLSEQAARQSTLAAEHALRDGIKAAVTGAATDTAIGLGDDVITSARAGAGDGHESQEHIDADLSF